MDTIPRQLVALKSDQTLFFFNDTAPTEIYTPSLHDALPISRTRRDTSSPTSRCVVETGSPARPASSRSEEHTSELQSLTNLVCRLLLEKKKKKNYFIHLPQKKNAET